MYIEQGNKQIGADRQVTMKEVKAHQKKLNSIAKAMAKIPGIGEVHVEVMHIWPGATH